MKIIMYQGDQGGSAFLRMFEPARVAVDAGYDVEVTSDVLGKSWQWPDGRVEMQELHVDPDLIVLQRPLAQQMHEVAKAAHRQGIPFVVDLDDDFHNVDPGNSFSAAADPRQSPLHNKDWLAKTLQLASGITVSTPRLLKYGHATAPATVVRNRLPRRILDIHKTTRTGRVGWTGSVSTHPKDLSRARGVLDQIETDFAVVGHPQRVAQCLGVPPGRVFHASTWLDEMEEYWRAVSDSMDVGIAPLDVTKFNKAKSWLKPLEFMSLGLPFVASPLPEYQLLVKLTGGGEIATSSTQWATRVHQMLENPEPYLKNSREWAEQNVIENHADEWFRVWERAVEHK